MVDFVLTLYTVDNTIYNNMTGVLPVFYLDSELTVESGTGMSDDPYVLR